MPLVSKRPSHFPVNCVLVGDGVRTLINAILVIREHGLKHRMPMPQSFMRQINVLSIEMTHARRTTIAKKNRKNVLRAICSLFGNPSPLSVTKTHSNLRNHSEALQSEGGYVLKPLGYIPIYFKMALIAWSKRLHNSS